ncbi:MAG: flagellar hook-length control protein FliK [Betaproteobacteria bacterium]|nr:flagellar hook-length control protein FliK [Betaproteobacteria bacterium]
MLPPEILSALKAYVQSRESLPLPTGAADGATSESQSFGLGQSVQGTVLAETSSGVFTVRVAQQLVQLNLPETIHTGDVVQLQVLSLQPRLTFGLSTSENPASSQQQLSDAARLLSNLTTDAPTKALIQSPTQTPLLSSANATPETAQLATQLQQAIQDSGLFYESHQAQWVAGALTTARLMTEPQNQLLPSPQPADANPSRPVPAEMLPFQTPQSQAAQSLLIQPPLSPGLSNPPGGTPAAVGHNPAVPPHLQPLVQQQLQALETGHILWQGQFFPGQNMQWEIWQQPGQGGGGQAPDPQQATQWATSIQLNLPHLGLVNARLQWSAAGVQVGVTAGSAQTLALMNQSRPQLLSALSAAGVTVSGATLAMADEPAS